MNKDFWQIKLNEYEKQYAEKVTMWENAGVATQGDYTNAMLKIEGQIAYAKNELQKFEQIASPNTVVFCVYILVAPQQDIASYFQVSNEEIHNCIPSTRYVNNDGHLWQPYEQQSIEQLLEEFTSKSKYILEKHYLDGNDNDKTHYTNIDDKIDKIIAIVDILSLNCGVHKDTANRLDTKRIAGLMTPICRKLPLIIQDYMEEEQKNTFTICCNYYEKGVCAFFEQSIPKKDNFLTHLFRLINSKVQIQSETKDKELDMSSIKTPFIK